MFVEALLTALSSFLRMAMIIIPIMVLIEVMRDLDLIDKLARLLRPLTRHLKIADEGTLLLAIGMVFGLTYGAGAIIQSAREGHLDRRSLAVVGIFLAVCHSVIEDGMLFTALGGSVWILVGLRFLTALLFAFLVARRIGISKKIA